MEPLGELLVLARDHGCRGQSLTDLLGEVRPRKDRDGPVAHERREPAPGCRVEPLRQAQHRAVLGQRGHDLAESAARNCEHDEVCRVEGRVVEHGGVDPLQGDVRKVLRVPPRLRDRAHLLGIAAGQRHVVTALHEQMRKCGSPGAGSDDDGVHARLTKSMATGTPSRSKRSRSWFSTQ